MTDFEKWHEKNWPLERSAGIDDCWDELKEAYEAGAASQSEDLRDKFAGKALIGLLKKEDWMKEYYLAKSSYEMADAMLEARKVTEEQGS